MLLKNLQQITATTVFEEKKNQEWVTEGWNELKLFVHTRLNNVENDYKKIGEKEEGKKGGGGDKKKTLEKHLFVPHKKVL